MRADLALLKSRFVCLFTRKGYITLEADTDSNSRFSILLRNRSRVLASQSAAVGDGRAVTKKIYGTALGCAIKIIAIPNRSEALLTRIMRRQL
jgi:hypothetical protein